MEQDDDVGRWTEGPILPALPPPPENRITVAGARLVHVLELGRDGQLTKGFREAVLLADAQLGDGAPAGLLAWAGWWREPDGRMTGRGRAAWCRLPEGRVKPARSVTTAPAGIVYAWYGQEEPNALGDAIERAALLLPARMRAAAIRPAATQGPQSESA